MELAPTTHRSHKKAKAGAKADKKRITEKKKRGLSTQRHNPRAFSVSNVRRTQRSTQRNLDRAQRKEYVPVVNRAEDEPPPFVTVVMGPPGCGKSTLIRSLVKFYSNSNIRKIAGPVTVVTGKRRRMTLFECPAHDLSAMVDLAKVADLVLLLIDASFGFEMETFEFLNILQVHGFPRVMGVLTKLDAFRENKALRNAKKKLKHRFWTEIYKGAKMFHMNGVTHGKYPKGEIRLLHLYMSRLKFRPLLWRNAHSYLLVDRVEDITDPREVQKHKGANDRDVALFGYVRGTHLKQNADMHLVGAGDFTVDSVSLVPDPCPVADTDTKLKTLKKKANTVYAPMSDIGSVRMDADAVYIDIAQINYTKRTELEESLNIGGSGDVITDTGRIVDPMLLPKDAPAHMLRALQDVSNPLEKKLHNAELALFRDGQSLSNAEAKLLLKGDQEEDGGADLENTFGEQYDSEDEEGGDRESKNGVHDDGTDEDDTEAEAEEEEDEDEDEDDEGSEDGSEDDEDDSEEKEEEEKEDSEDIEEEEIDDGRRSAKGSTGDTTQFWKHNIAEKAAERFMSRRNRVSLMEMVYGAGAEKLLDSKLRRDDVGEADDAFLGEDPDAENDSDEEELFVLKQKGPEHSEAAQSRFGDGSTAQDNAMDRTRPPRRRCLRSMDEAEAFGGVQKLYDRATGRGAAGPATERGAVPTIWALEGDDLESPIAKLKERFVTGTWAGANPNNPGSDGDANEDDEEVFGDFEDLETGEKFNGDHDEEDDASGEEDVEDVDSGEEDADTDGSGLDEEAMEEMNEDIDAALRQENARRKAESRKRKDFDSAYDSQKQLAADEDGDEEAARAAAEAAARKESARQLRNKQEFGEDGELQRLLHEGYRQGLYVRVVLHNVPPEFLKRFSPLRPLILGGLGVQEGRTGFLKARFKRHRWFPKTLKCQDPLVFSVGWRRFQSLPVFSIEDANARSRYLKYTPEHMHCGAHFFGALCPPNTGVLAFQKLSGNVTGFRVAGTGVITQLDATVNVVKKLKLTGVPFKVFKNTAFIKDMFTSDLEVAKFTGAAVKTVSGIRGTIKKSLSDGVPGSFRATFEDRISMGDIVICRLWVPVEPKRFYNPVTSLLDDSSASERQPRRQIVEGARGDGPFGGEESAEEEAAAEDAGWLSARNTSQLRHDHDLAIPTNNDSVYKGPVERAPKVFAPLRIPRKLQAALPYSAKPKLQKRRAEKTGKARKTYMKARAVVRDPEERRRYTLLQSLASIGNEKKEKAKKANAERIARKQKEDERASLKFKAVKDAQKKRKYRELGKEEARKRRKAGLED
mmetsp:Transcript_11990/g.44557  ORF Transcript_11990/g.44557 Transcript_11990/m.44557 type:complete len:1313 (-) Transcript_11990:29-3967(-)